MNKPGLYLKIFLLWLLLSSSAGASDLYFQALQLERANDDQAEVLFAEAARGDLPMADHASYRLIRNAYQSDDFREVLEKGNDHLTRFPFSRFSPEIQLITAEALCDAGAFAQALAQVESYMRQWPKKEPARTHALRGMALAGLGRGLEAQQSLAEAAYIYGYESWSARAKKEAAAIEGAGLASRLVPTKGRFIEEIDAAWGRSHFITCQSLCNTYVQLFPGKDSWRYQLKAVDCLLERKRRGDARRLLESVTGSIPENDEATAALLLRWARAERGNDFKGRPQTNFWEIAEQFPKTEAGIMAAFYIGYLQFDGYDFPLTIQWMDSFLSKWKQPYLLDQALWYSGFSHFLEGNPGKAVERFDRLEKEFPNHKDLDRAVYWRGRSFEKMNHPAKAKENYRWLTTHYFGTYYGLAAQIRLESLGEPSSSEMERLSETIPWEHLLPILPVPRLDPDWAQQYGGGPELDEGALSALEYFSSRGDIRLRRIVGNFLAAYRAGELDLAEENARYLHSDRMDVPYAGYLASLMFSLCNENLMAILAANDTAVLIRKGELFDPHRVNARRQLPQLFTEVVSKAAERYDLDPWLVLALVKQESAFQIVATSHVGARGLFQVMPSTGRWIAQKRGIKGFSPKDLYDPETSADFGTWYFHRLLTNNNQDVVKALTGYNAGGSRADRWWAENPERTYDEIIELLGFYETQMYVKIILRNWEMYQRLYLDPHLPMGSRKPVFAILFEQISPAYEKGNE